MGVLGWRAGSIMPWVTSGKSFASLSLSFHVCKTRIQRSPVGIGVRAGDNWRVWWALCLLGGSSGTDAHGVCAGPATCPREQRKQSWSGPRVGGGAGDGAVRWLPEGCRRWPGPPVPGPIPSPLTSGSASSLSRRRAVQPQLGLVPSVFPACWDWASLLFPSYHPARASHHLPPTILWTLPQSPQAPGDGSRRRPGRFPDIISGVGSGWPSKLELGWGREARLHLRAACFRPSGSAGLLPVLFIASEFRKSLSETSSAPTPGPTPPPTSAPRLFNRSRAVVSLSLGKSSGRRKLSAQL